MSLRRVPGLPADGEGIGGDVPVAGRGVLSGNSRSDQGGGEQNELCARMQASELVEVGTQL